MKIYKDKKTNQVVFDFEGAIVIIPKELISKKDIKPQKINMTIKNGNFLSIDGFTTNELLIKIEKFLREIKD